MAHRENWVDQPIWKLEVEYERWQERAATRGHIKHVADILYGFLKTYPKLTKPEDFLVTHVEDWAIGRARHYAAYTVACDVNIIRAFFEWLRNHKGLSIPNPATRRKTRGWPKREPGYVEIDQVVQLIRAAHGVDKEIVSRTLRGQPTLEVARDLSIDRSTVHQRFGRLCMRTGFPLKLQGLRLAYPRLCLRLGELQVLSLVNSAPEEAQPSSQVASNASHTTQPLV
jgi:integrase